MLQLDHIEGRASYGAEKIRLDIDLVDEFYRDAEFKVFQKPADSFTIHKVNSRSAVAGCLPARIGGKRAGCDNEALISSADHRAPKITYHARADRTLPPLALKEHVEGD